MLHVRGGFGKEMMAAGDGAFGYHIRESATKMNSFQSEEIEYRVWPAGTVQEAAEPPYDWMSDDFMIVVARTEEKARATMYWRHGDLIDITKIEILED